MTSHNSALYDVPGPRSRRVSLIGSIVAGVVVIIGAYYLVYRPLQQAGQFTQEKWGPLLDPNNEFFDQVWERIGQGLVGTLKAAALAILASLILGTLLAVLRVQLVSLLERRFVGVGVILRYGARGASWILVGLTRVCVEVFRGLPVVITIFFVSRLGPEIGFSVGDPLWYVVVGLTIYNMVVIGEILRSGMMGLQFGQREAALSLGLSSFQATRMILLPQAYKIMLPSIISQLVVIVKDTSLGVLIAYVELLTVGKQIIGVLRNPVQVYIVIAVIFIVMNYGLSKLAQYIQSRQAST